MDKEKELPQRKRLRLKDFDYSTPGAYFVTLCTEGRRQILSRIVGVDVLGDPKNAELLPHGMVADKYIKQTSFVSHFVSTFKRFCNKEYGENIWQRGFHDHIIRNRRDYEKISKYIYENPIIWRYDCFYTEE